MLRTGIPGIPLPGIRRNRGWVFYLKRLPPPCWRKLGDWNPGWKHLLPSLKTGERELVRFDGNRLAVGTGPYARQRPRHVPRGKREDTCDHAEGWRA